MPVLSHHPLPPTVETRSHPLPGSPSFFPPRADYLLREIAGEYAIIPVGAACQISNAVMVPNDTAVFLWNTFQQPHTISEVVAQAAEEYEAPEEKIQDSVLNFVHDTLKYQLLEEVVSL